MFRLFFLLLIVLSVIYIVLSVWSRNQRRRKLGEWWDEKRHTGNREAFIERGLRQYDKSVRRKMLLGVYVVPLVLIGVIIYVTNFQ